MLKSIIFSSEALWSATLFKPSLDDCSPSTYDVMRPASLATIVSSCPYVILVLMIPGYFELNCRMAFIIYSEHFKASQSNK